MIMADRCSEKENSGAFMGVVMDALFVNFDAGAVRYVQCCFTVQ